MQTQQGAPRMEDPAAPDLPAQMGGMGAVSKSGNPLLQSVPGPPMIDSSVEEDFVSIRVNYFNDSTAAEFAEKVSKAHSTGQPVIPVTISSWGGLVTAGIQMYAAVQRSQLPVLTYAEDRAMSCGFFLLAIGTPGYRFVDPNAELMDHQAFYGVIGKDAEVENQQEHNRRAMDKFYRLMDEACGHEEGFFKDRWEDLNNLNDYLTAEEGVEIGAADEVGRPRIEAEATIDWTLTR